MRRSGARSAQRSRASCSWRAASSLALISATSADRFRTFTAEGGVADADACEQPGQALDAQLDARLDGAAGHSGL